MNHPVPLTPPVTNTTTSELSDVLKAASEKVSALGIGVAALGERLAELGERLREERFHLAVLGQFKRGKSTLLNALLGDRVLPTAVLPVTAIPTFLRGGDERRCRVELGGHRSEMVAEGDAVPALLSKFATERSNPENRLGVSRVEVYHPAPLLRDGVVLIDTPGIGSTHVHNTTTTLEFLPHCDAALFLTSVDPPLTQVELEFLREARPKLARLFFVMNKIDTVAQGDRFEALRFFERILREEVASGEEIRVFGVSARDGLEAKIANDSALWERSGMGEVERYLVRFLAREKKKTLERAVESKAKDVLAAALLEGRLAVRSLELPAAVLDERLGLLERAVERAGGEQSRAADLLAGDERRLAALLEEKALEWRRDAHVRFDEVLRDALAQSGAELVSHQAVEKALAERLSSFFERALIVATGEFERHCAELVEPHQNRLHEIVESVRRAAAEIFEVPYRAQTADRTFTLEREPFWITQKWTTSLSPVPEGFFDRLLPAAVRRRRLQVRFAAKIEALVVENVENLRWTLLQEIGRSFRRFRRELEEGLSDAVAAIRGAIQAASARRREHSETVAEEVARLGGLLDEIEALEQRLGSAEADR